jgi:CarD family transcriptional regulator
LDFKVGDKVVYPNHGVGIIEDIKKRTIGDLTSKFYRLQIIATASTVMIPIDNIEVVGLRKVISKREVSKITGILKSDEVTTYDDWKGRFQANSDKMRTGDVYAVAEVLKSLTVLNDIKPLSYRERKMLDRARFLLISELAEASGKDEEKMEEAIDKLLDAFLKAAKEALAD